MDPLTCIQVVPTQVLPLNPIWASSYDHETCMGTAGPMHKKMDETDHPA